MAPPRLYRLEAALEGDVVRWAEDRLVLQTKLNLRGRNGWPDRCFWLPGGRPLLHEYKLPGEAPRPLQEYTIRQLRERGYDVEVHTSYEEATEAIARRLLRGG